MNLKTSIFSVGILGIVASSVFLMPQSAHASGPVIRSGNAVGVEADQVLEGDFYALGQSVTISGTARQDVYALGGTVTINAPIGADLVIGGGTVQVHAPIADDVRILGGEVVIAEPVADDVLVIGGSVRLLSTASIGGDLIVYGGDVTVEGAVAGTVYGRAEMVRIDASVGGDVSLTVGQSLTLGDKATIKGGVMYTSPEELIRAPGTVIDGSLSYTKPARIVERPTLEALVFNLLTLGFSALSLYFIMRSRVSSLAHAVGVSYGKFGLIGLGVLFAVPLLSIMLMVSVIGAPLGVALLVLHVLIMIGALMILPVVCGFAAQKLVRQGSEVGILTVVLGVVVVCVLPLVPVVGSLLVLVGYLMVFGALYHVLYERIRGEQE